MRSVIRRLPRVVQDAHVAGAQPAVGVERLGRGLRVLEVAAHDVEAADQHLAGLAGGPAPSRRHRTSVPGIARPDVDAMTGGSSPRRHIVTMPLASERP